ncbi:winged helix-turn-helix transcriptional regulator [Secundilactobacillus similis]|jgi:DNA-binding HxlR family transcriptional regulator|uniref:HxlR family transcriptional regulator n=1 Tax=Secundilactobacillus similis DSM 23365 = JCM 2765 TaxID=1423804 RepID=A0A0R2EXP4_9LACO|nr:helix-turn-helix domain-containing protein [Secundilactobacillus similis]KRN21208.1 HxlR family transcriptional regulator [Secundilactobacillus similis DSM 23365 = JCM 2765]
MTDLVRNEVLQKLADGAFNCPKEFTLSMFSGKWKINMIYHMGKEGAYYFNEFQKLLPAASHKELAEKLKELVADGLVVRTEEAGQRRKVSYALTPLGETLLPIVNAMYDWGTQRLAELKMQDVKFGLGQVKSTTK